MKLVAACASFSSCISRKLYSIMLVSINFLKFNAWKKSKLIPVLISKKNFTNSQPLKLHGISYICANAKSMN